MLNCKTRPQFDVSSVAQPVKAVDDLAHTVQEGVAIRIVLDDIVPGVASGRHMVERSVKLHAQRARHDRCRYHTALGDSKIQDLTLISFPHAHI